MPPICVRIRRARFAVIVGMIGVAASSLVLSTTDADARRGRRHHVQKGGGYAPPYAAMVVDVKSGRTLHAVNEDATRHPASVTKVMTLYLLFEALDSGRVSLSSEIPISSHAASQAPSKLGLRPGSTIDVEDAIKALVTKSANDVAAAIGEYLGGTEEGFAERMTRKAHQLGMSRTHYANASGLPDPEQVTTARDLTILARAIQERFPTYYRYFQTRVFNYAGRSHGNHNRLLGRVEGVDGIKTGFTRASGFNLMTSARIGDRHIVTVVLGGRSGASRDNIVAALVRENLPRAYAGARTAPMIADSRSAEPPPRARVAEADVENTVATTASTRPSRPLDINPIRAAVAAASGGSATTTPSSLRWSSGAPALPAAAAAFAAASNDPGRAMPVPIVAGAAKVEARVPLVHPAPPRPEPVVRIEAPTRLASVEPKRETVKEGAKPASGWVIQLGATDEESKAKTILEQARSKASGSLGRAAPFTEKVVSGGATLYRARFSGFPEADDAQGACKALKRSGFACFATRI